MIGKAQRTLHDRKGRISPADPRKDTATRNEKIVDTEYTGIAVHHTLLGGVGHACSAQLVIGMQDELPPDVAWVELTD